MNQHRNHAIQRRGLFTPLALALAGLLLSSCTNKPPRTAAEVHYYKGVDLEKRDKFQEAEKEFREAIRMKPDYAEAHDMLGVNLTLQGKYEEAISETREAIRLRPDDYDTHFFLGVLLMNQEKFGEAEGQFREAIRLKPDFVSSLTELGRCLDCQGRRKEGRLFWEMAYKEDRRAVHWWQHLLFPQWADRYKKRLAEPD